MNRFITLVSIENRKMWKRISTTVMLLIVLGLVLVTTSVMRYYQYSNHVDVKKAPVASATWRTQLQQEIQQDQEGIASIEKGTKNFAARSELNRLKITVAQDQYRLDHDIALEQPNSVWTKVSSLEQNAGFGAIAALMMIIACSAAVAGEFSEGTIKMAVSRPCRRWELLTAKLVAALLYGLLLIAVALGALILMQMIFYGVPGVGAKEMLTIGGTVHYIPAVLKMLILFGLEFLQAVFYTVLAFALSALTRSRSLATGFSLFMLLLGEQLARLVAVYFPWAKYFPFTMTDFRNIALSGSMLEGVSLSMALAFTGAYTLLIGAVGYTVFAKRDI